MSRAEFAEAVYTFCFLTGASVTSWIRTPSHNAEIGGVKTSPHLFGLGADVTYDYSDSQERRKDCARRAGLRLLAERDHDHLQPLDWTPDGA